MTRTTLLQLLAQPTSLNGADVRALEELAVAFPYCQTAHLLLAKAAHDQGSMLAGQRLRRAATYAADRTLLRQLIELPAPALAAPTTLALAEAPVAQPVAADSTDQPYPPLPIQPSSSSAVSAEEPEIIDNQDTKLLIDLPEQVLVPAAPTVAEDLQEDELPPQAPPVRPPEGAEVASTEFGLAEVSPVEITAYQLPELADSTEEKPPVGTPLLPPFSGLADVGYAPAEGSRLGFCLLPLGSSEPTATTLPPAGEFFAPDASLLAHLAAQQPALPKASSLDLINSFLQRAPTATRRRAVPPPDEEETQADLSVRSTRTELDLASESLAKILARQGKVDRATAIYEQLMVKHPEKMAYFAAQIDSLRPTA